MGEGGAAGPDDVTRRTHLANERTFLAWWRTALAALALSVGLGRVLPEVLGGAVWPYVVVGVGWGLVGVCVAAYAGLRMREVRRSLDTGGFAHPAPAMIVAVTVAAVILGVATVVVVVWAP